MWTVFVPFDKQGVEEELRKIPRLIHDDGDHVLPDYPAIAERVWNWITGVRLISSLPEEFPDDMCSCGRSAYEAVGDSLQDHEKTCVVYLTARIKRLEIVIDSCCSEPRLTSWEIINRLRDILEEGS